MARSLRIEFPGAWYHVMNRGAGRRAIFKTDSHRRLFLDLLGELDTTFRTETHAYCLLDTHYHLLLRTPEGNLSRAMRHLNGLYTQRYNRLTRSDGPVFRGRYKSLLVDSDGYLLQVSRYIHRNAVEAGIAKHAERYRWSSYPGYAGIGRRPEWLRLDEVLGAVGGRQARARYRRYVEDGMDEETKRFYEQKRLGPIIGSEGYRKRIAALLGKGKGTDPSEYPDRKRIEVRPRLPLIVAKVAKAFGSPERKLYQSIRGRGRGHLARKVAMAMARIHGGYELKEVARAFGVGHYSSVSVAVSRLRAQMREDARLRSVVNGLAQELSGQ